MAVTINVVCPGTGSFSSPECFMSVPDIPDEDIVSGWPNNPRIAQTKRGQIFACTFLTRSTRMEPNTLSGDFEEGL